MSRAKLDKTPLAELDLSELSDEDLKYLHDRGRISDADFEANADGSESGDDDDSEESDYADWTKKELAAELENRGLEVEGTKDELIARLEGADNASDS